MALQKKSPMDPPDGAYSQPGRVLASDASARLMTGTGLTKMMATGEMKNAKMSGAGSMDVTCSG